MKAKARNVKKILNNGSLKASDFAKSHVEDWLKRELREV